MSAINSDVLGGMLVDDLITDHGYTESEAKEWVKKHADSLVSEMWDAYSDYKDKNVKGLENDK